jgi:hypothetical protein
MSEQSKKWTITWAFCNNLGSRDSLGVRCLRVTCIPIDTPIDEGSLLRSVLWFWCQCMRCDECLPTACYDSSGAMLGGTPGQLLLHTRVILYSPYYGDSVVLRAARRMVNEPNVVAAATLHPWAIHVHPRRGRLVVCFWSCRANCLCDLHKDGFGRPHIESCVNGGAPTSPVTVSSSQGIVDNWLFLCEKTYS